MLDTLTRSGITILGARPYEEVRKLCHDIKGCKPLHEYDKELFRVVNSLPRDSILIPVPGRSGIAVATLRLAVILQDIAFQQGKSCRIADCLKSNPHGSLYEMKKSGGNPADVPLEMQLKGFSRTTFIKNEANSRIPVLLDNVIDTGTTMRAAVKATGIETLLVVGDSGNWK